MKVIRARTAGFCMGVSLALRRLDEALEAWKAAGGRESGGRLATLGPIIHNPRVIAEYAEAGVLCLEEAEAVLPGDLVLIRAHGLAREAEARLASSGARVIDATCPKVKKAQTAIKAAWENRGGALLLFGEARHPEVKGLVSYTGGQALVFGTEAEAEALDLSPDLPYFLAAQTTQDQEAFLRIHVRLQERLGCDVPVLRTICDATRKRQEEAIALARGMARDVDGRVDGVVVVGGRNSGNTRRLAEVAGGQGVPVLLVEDAKDLPLEQIRAWKTAGLTAGASTPAAHMDAMQKTLEGL